MLRHSPNIKLLPFPFWIFGTYNSASHSYFLNIKLKYSIRVMKIFNVHVSFSLVCYLSFLWQFASCPFLPCTQFNLVHCLYSHSNCYSFTPVKNFLHILVSCNSYTSFLASISSCTCCWTRAKLRTCWVTSHPVQIACRAIHPCVNGSVLVLSLILIYGDKCEVCSPATIIIIHYENV